jgi:hypothetical protein
MKSVLAATVLVGLSQLGGCGGSARASQASDVLPLDSSVVPNVGRVDISALDGRILVVEIDSGGASRTQRIELDSLSAGALIVGAKAGPWLEHGLVIALAIQVDGPTTAYHYWAERDARTAPATVQSSHRDESGVGLSKELFRATGGPYRIVEVNRPRQGDVHEITFRRGFPKVNSGEADVDEKIFFDGCGGIGWPGFGSGKLYEATSFRPSR